MVVKSPKSSNDKITSWRKCFPHLPKDPNQKKHENENEKIILIGQILLKKIKCYFFLRILGDKISHLQCCLKKKKKKEMIVRPLNCLSSEPK